MVDLPRLAIGVALPRAKAALERARRGPRPAFQCAAAPIQARMYCDSYSNGELSTRLYAEAKSSASGGYHTLTWSYDGAALQSVEEDCDYVDESP